MPPAEAADPWSEVWDAYEARQAGLRPPPALLPPAPRRSEAVARPAPRRRRRLMALAACLAFGLAGFSGPARPLLGMAGLALWPDVPALLGGLDLPSNLPAPSLTLPPMPPLQAIGGREAERYLASLAGEVTEGWRDPEALRRMMLARQGLPPVRNAALRPLEAVRRLRPLGWGAVRLEIGPAQGPGGLGLDLAWEAGGWRVTRLQLLDPPDGQV
ncbi:hypothetical protein QMO56_00185 [Roseomonas sp. E05]|uniref:hypothetical protein n=1 Tax=Roseomonas sp. E05 TaxID=3046310 RepID=UPI0024BAF29C|nr:hypothetical protein [Roseomonas sp. E05]MDJ0386513.1 hypothetical protein [Roseomonas sp. E05]